MLQVKYGLGSWPESLTPPVRSPFPVGKRIVSLKPPMYKQILENSQLVNWGLPMCLGTIGMRFMLSVWFVCLHASQSFLLVSVRHFRLWAQTCLIPLSSLKRLLYCFPAADSW